MKRLRHAAETALVLLSSAVGQVFGRGAARRLGRMVGSIWFRCNTLRRRVAERNLSMSLPHLDAARREAVARASFRHFGELVMDLLAFSRFGPEDADRLAEVEGWEHLERAQAKGRGVLVFSAHFGHWELVGLLQGFRGLPMDLITRPLDNPFLERLLTRLRCHSGNRVVHKRRAVRGILQALRERRTVGMVIDQNYRGTNPFFVDFFGQAAATTPTLGLLAVRTGAPVVPVFCWPQEDGRYRVVYLPEVSVEPTGDRGSDAYRVTERCTQLIEDQIRARPEFWWWMHQRWKTRPLEALPQEAVPRPALHHRRRAQG